jgi:hypothetical protein
MSDGATEMMLDAKAEIMEQIERANDVVHFPNHYKIAEGIEVIDIIEKSLTPEQFEGYLLGNILKYRLRAGEKGDLKEDIGKSNRYRDWLRMKRS